MVVRLYCRIRGQKYLKFDTFNDSGCMVLWRYFRHWLIQLFYTGVCALMIIAACLNAMSVIRSFTWWVHSCYGPLIMGFMITWPLACDLEGNFVVSWCSARIYCSLGCKNILRFYWRNVALVYLDLLILPGSLHYHPPSLPSSFS